MRETFPSTHTAFSANKVPRRRLYVSKRGHWSEIPTKRTPLVSSHAGATSPSCMMLPDLPKYPNERGGPGGCGASLLMMGTTAGDKYYLRSRAGVGQGCNFRPAPQTFGSHSRSLKKCALMRRQQDADKTPTRRLNKSPRNIFKHPCAF